MADIKVKFVKKNPDGSLVVQLPGGGTRVVQPHQVQRAGTDPSGADELKADIAAGTQQKKDEKRHSEIDNLIDTLPTAVGTGASILGGGKELPTGLLAAGAGGVLGEDLREIIGAHAYTDPNRKAAVKNMTPTDVLEKLGVAGAEQSTAELLSRGVGGAATKLPKTAEEFMQWLKAGDHTRLAENGGITGWLARKIGIPEAAESQIAAEAGRGVQLTPGEARGDKTGGAFIRAIEKFLPHVPGAMGPMERFAEKRLGQVSVEEGVTATEKAALESAGERAAAQAGARGQAWVDSIAKRTANQQEHILANALDSISKSKFTREQQGEAVGNVVQKMREEGERAAGDAYAPLKKKLGIPTDHYVPKEDLDAAARKAGSKEVEELRQADKAYATAQSEIEKSLATKISKAGKPEAAHQYVARSSLKDLRALLPRLDTETKQGLSRSIVEDALGAAKNPKAALKVLDNIDKNGPKMALLMGPTYDTVRASLKELVKIQEQATADAARMAGSTAAEQEAIRTTTAGRTGTLDKNLEERTAHIKSDVPMGKYKGAHAAYGLLTLPASELGLGLATGHGLAGAAVAGGTAILGGLSARALAEGITNPKLAAQTLVFLRRIAQGTIRVVIPAGIDLYNGATVPQAGDPAQFRQADPIAAAMGETR